MLAGTVIPETLHGSTCGSWGPSLGMIDCTVPLETGGGLSVLSVFLRDCPYGVECFSGGAIEPLNHSNFNNLTIKF